MLSLSPLGLAASQGTQSIFGLFVPDICKIPNLVVVPASRGLAGHGEREGVPVGQAQGHRGRP